MINFLEIRRQDSAVVNAVVICHYFCMMKRQDGTIFALTKCFDYLVLPPYCALRVGKIFSKKLITFSRNNRKQWQAFRLRGKPSDFNFTRRTL